MKLLSKNLAPFLLCSSYLPQLLLKKLPGAGIFVETIFKLFALFRIAALLPD
jgi:hypothetical protein